MNNPYHSTIYHINLINGNDYNADFDFISHDGNANAMKYENMRLCKIILIIFKKLMQIYHFWLKKLIPRIISLNKTSLIIDIKCTKFLLVFKKNKAENVRPPTMPYSKLSRVHGVFWINFMTSQDVCKI